MSGVRMGGLGSKWVSVAAGVFVGVRDSPKPKGQEKVRRQEATGGRARFLCLRPPDVTFRGRLRLGHVFGPARPCGVVRGAPPLSGSALHAA